MASLATLEPKDQGQQPRDGKQHPPPVGPQKQDQGVLALAGQFTQGGLLKDREFFAAGRAKRGRKTDAWGPQPAEQVTQFVLAVPGHDELDDIARLFVSGACVAGVSQAQAEIVEAGKLGRKLGRRGFD